MASHGDPRFRLVFDEALRAVEVQAGRHDDLRSRTAALVAVASIVTAFLGGQALGDGRSLGTWTWVAVTAFAVLVALAVYVLTPRRGARFVTSARRLLGTYVEAAEPADVDVIYRDLALHLEDDYHANARSVIRLTFAVQASSVLLIVEIAAWLVDLGGRR